MVDAIEVQVFGSLRTVIGEDRIRLELPCSLQEAYERILGRITARDGTFPPCAVMVNGKNAALLKSGDFGSKNLKEDDLVQLIPVHLAG